MPHSGHAKFLEHIWPLVFLAVIVAVRLGLAIGFLRLLFIRVETYILEHDPHQDFIVSERFFIFYEEQRNFNAIFHFFPDNLHSCMKQLLKISEYAEMKRVTIRTVWNWIRNGSVNIERTLTGRVRVVIESNHEKTVAIYARVSSSENKANLQTQASRLISYCNAKGYKVSKVISEIGSGLNDERKQLEKLLTDKSIDLIVVEHKDRLARFGVNYIRKLLNSQGRDIEIVNDVDDDKTDLMQDFVSVITSFCARIYGLCRSRRKTEQIIRGLEKSNGAD